MNADEIVKNIEHYYRLYPGEKRLIILEYFKRLEKEKPPGYLEHLFNACLENFSSRTNIPPDIADFVKLEKSVRTAMYKSRCLTDHSKKIVDPNDRDATREECKCFFAGLGNFLRGKNGQNDNKQHLLAGPRFFET